MGSTGPTERKAAACDMKEHRDCNVLGNDPIKLTTIIFVGTATKLVILPPTSYE